jgi:hypothetical protein
MVAHVHLVPELNTYGLRWNFPHIFTEWLLIKLAKESQVVLNNNDKFVSLNPKDYSSDRQESQIARWSSELRHGLGVEFTTCFFGGD